MQFIKEKGTQFLSVQLPYIGAAISLLVLLLQWGLDFKLIPTDYQLIVTTMVLPLLAHAGRKIAQPSLHSNIQNFATITAGHSNSDPGSVNGKFKESELVTQFRNAVAYYLREAGIEVKTDGVGTINQNLNTALKLIKGSSISVEFHMNAAKSKQANGVETIALPEDRRLAQALSKAVADAFGFRLRGENGWIDQTKSHRGSLGYIRNGGLIVELGFISNDEELSQFNARYWQAAKAVAQVLIEYDKK